VAPLADREPLARLDQVARAALEVGGEARARVERVERDQRVEGVDHRLAQRAQLLGELEEDALHLVLLARLELADAVAELHRGGGSTNTVAPVPLASCTMPPTAARACARTGIT
jgi:hypothetical protein